MLDMIDNKRIDVKQRKTAHIKATGHDKSYLYIVLSCLADSTKYVINLIQMLF